ncbi:hypothetical protein Lfu02_54820 [Longispora fulva]|uniref:Uncharacterized protein n=1 Tax=Longispora fulva TaxID=619741 RepID=A0A8J7GUD8_9ACTN|nr:hypothetical protein [Longispora fulva]MBG6137536.1 hypothetical protein [Longispora fulva]GIG61110.1 hypothetical protein Lfu02_54820 [Longispora fulva]
MTFREPPEDIDRLKVDLDHLGHKALRETLVVYRKTLRRSPVGGKKLAEAVFQATFGIFAHAVALLYMREWIGGPIETEEERQEVKRRSEALALRVVEWEAGATRKQGADTPSEPYELRAVLDENLAGHIGTEGYVIRAWSDGQEEGDRIRVVVADPGLGRQLADGLAQWADPPRPVVPKPKAPELAVIGASERVSKSVLVNGRKVLRLTGDARAKHHVSAEMPCCERLIEIPLTAEFGDRAVCPSCKLTYWIELVDEDYEGGWTAVFEVEGDAVFASLRKNPNAVGIPD